MIGLTNRFNAWTFSRVAVLVVALVLGLMLQLASAATPQSGIDCGSTKVGSFVSPVAPQKMPLQPTYSTHGIYQVAAQYGSGTNPPITLTISKGTATVMTLDVPYTSTWGFSPDDDRFVYHYLDGDYHTVNLYDLARSGTANDKLVTSFAGPVGAASVVFSPNGKYFMYARLTGGLVPATYISVVDARSGALKYETNFMADIPPQDDGKVRVANWGFSPDLLDRTFVYAYITGQSSAQLTAVNLGAASVAERLVHEETIVGDPAAFWKFSPSGDVLGVVVQSSQTAMTISLHRTAYRQQLMSGGFTPVGSVVLKTTSAWHVVNINGTGDQQLAPNTAGEQCTTPGTAELSSLTVSPSTVTSGSTATGTVTLTAAAPTDVSVALSSNNLAATMPASVTVQSGHTSATFSVNAGTVSSSTPVTLTASLGSVTKTVSLTVSPELPAITSFTLYQPSIVGGSYTAARIDLSGPAPGGTTIQVSSDNPAVQPPSGVLVTTGARAVEFTVNSSVVPAETMATITAQLGSSTKTASLTLVAVPSVASFAIAPSSAVGGKNDPYPVGTITLSAPAPPYTYVNVSSSNPQVAYCSSSVRIPDGTTTGSFNISSFPVGTETVVTFTVDSGNGGPKTATLTVTPPVLGEVTIPGGRIPGGRTVKATVSLDPGPPPGGAVISLSSDNPAAVVPATVTVPSTVSGANFNIVTSPVTKHTLVTISATYKGVTKSATLKVLGPPTYTVVDVGNLGGGWTAIQGINALGSAVGTSNIDAYRNGRGYIWANGTLTRLDGMLGAEAVNNLGEVAGRTEVRIVDSYRGRAVLYRGGSYLTFEPAAGFLDSRATDINDAGQIVGYSYTAYSAAPSQGFLWQDGIRTELPFTPLAVNRWGQATGNTAAAVLWDKGTLQDLGVPADRTKSAAEDLNDSGTVVGIVDKYDANGQIEFFRAARWEKGVWTEFGTLGGRNSAARAVNNFGQIAGKAEFDPNQVSLARATLWQKNGELIDLSDEVPFDEGWWLQDAFDINDAGQIVAVAVKGSYAYPGATHGVILTPIAGPAPNTADLSLTVAHSPEPVAVGGNLTYTFTLGNSGPLDASAVLLTDTMPTGVTFKSVSASTGTASQSGGKVTWQIPSLAKDASATLTIVVTATAAGSITNSATVTADQIDPVPANNRATTTATVVAGGDTTAPVTTATVSTPPNASGWNNADVTVTLAATDEGGSGVDRIEYILDAGATWVTYAAPVIVSKEGENAIQYRSRDKSGNVETAKTVTIKIDKTVPSGEISINGGAASTNTPAVTLTLAANDGTGSGVAKMRLAATSEGLKDATWVDFASSASYTLASGDGMKTVYVQFHDAAGNVSATYSDDISLNTSADTTGPTITVTSPADLAVVPAGTAIAFSAQDSGIGLAPGSPYGTLFDGTNKKAVVSGYQPPAGVYTLTVTASDLAGNETQSQTISFTVYDPAAGFVTGAGVIDSPAGAYVADPSLVGKAFFGFVSRYEKGATAPTGKAGFEFKVATLSFHGTSFQWLVVNKANNNAQFKGLGLINGQKDKNGKEYKFQIWATNGSPDTFRIKIWWEDGAGEHPVYDNGKEQALVGGNVLVQNK